RFTGAERLAIGLSHTGRYTPDSEEAAGLFVGTVVQDIKIDLNSTLPAYFDSVRLSISEALEHPYAPYDELVEALGFSPVSTMLSYEKGGGRIPDWPNIQAEPIELPTFGATNDLALDLVEMDDGLKVNLIHSEAFSPELAQIIGQYLLDLAKVAASNQRLTVEEAQNEADRTWKAALGPALINHKAPPKGFDLIMAMESTVRRYPDKTAVIGGGFSLTYRELWTCVEALSEKLSQLNLKPETVVGIFLPRVPWHVVSVFGVLKADLTFMSIPLDAPIERLKLLLDEAEAKVLLSLERPDWLPESIFWLNPADLKEFIDNGNQSIKKEPDSTLSQVDATDKSNNLAYILFTSGSTGKPKGVMIERGGLNNQVYWFMEHYHLTSQDRLACFAPFVFDISNADTFPTLLAGGELHILSEEDRHDGTRLWNYLKENKITIASLLANLTELLPGEEFPDLRLVLSCGEPLHLASPKGNYQHYNTYGPTEFTVTSHTFRLDGTNPPPIGRPVYQSQGFILDQNGRICPPGRTGQLAISGCQVARGYFGQPELTGQKFVPNLYPPTDKNGQILPGFERMYLTGDRCRLLPSGDISYLSRIDRQFKMRGQRMEPAEVERAMLDKGLVTQAVVTKISEIGKADLLWAYLVPIDAPIPEIRDFLSKTLPAYMVPDGFTALDRFPKNSNGKVDHKALPKPSLQAATIDLPQTPEEIFLASIWCAELNLDQVGRLDNFFSLGGDSVKVIKVTSAIRSTGYNLEAADFYLYQSLAELAQRLSSTSKSNLNPDPDKPDPDGPSGGGGGGPSGGGGGGPSGGGGGGPSGVLSGGPSGGLPGGTSGNPTGGGPVGLSGRPAGGASGDQCPFVWPSPLRTPEPGGPGVLSETGLLKTSLAKETADDDIWAYVSHLSPAQRESIVETYGQDLAAVFPLSPLQRAILSQMGLSDRNAYIEQVRLTLSSFEVPKFQQRLADLLASSDLFRFCLHGEDSSSQIPVQILRHSQPTIDEVLYSEDLSHLSNELAAARISEIEAAQVASLTRLDQAPLFRLALLTNPRGGYELSLTSHHLFLDAWSLGLLFGYLLGALDLSFKVGWVDYLKMLARVDLEGDRRFWLKSLGQVNEITELPGFKPGSANRVIQKRQSELPDLTGRILEAAAKLRVSPALFLEAAWAVTAARAARVSQVTYAVIDNGRNLPLTGLEEILGPCLVTIPRVLEYDQNLTFEAFLSNLTGVMAEAIPHSTLPLSALLSADRSYGQSLAHLAPSMMHQVFNYRPFQKWPDDLGILEVNENNRSLGFNLAVNWERTGENGHLLLEMAYDQGAFRSEAILSLAGSYLTLAEAAAKNPKTLLKDLPLCSEDMVRSLVQEHNAPAVTYPPGWIWGAFFNQYGIRPKARAIITKNSVLTYEELYRYSHKIALSLKPFLDSSSDLNNSPTRPLVALMMPRSLSYPVSLFGVMEAGGAFVPLDHQAPLERLIFQLTETRARVLLTDNPEESLIASLRAALPDLKIINLAPVLADGHRVSAGRFDSEGPGDSLNQGQSQPVAPGDPESLAYVFYTSGTTGRPKGVKISHQANYNQIKWLGEVYGLAPDQVMGAYAAWTFDVSLMEILLPLSLGAAVYLFNPDERQEISAVRSAVVSHKFTHLWLPPQVARIYLNHYPLQGLKVFNAGGDLFPPPMNLNDRGGCRLINGYGPTECAITVSYCDSGPEGWPLSLGQPASNCPLYVLDDNGSILPPFFPGQLAVGGVQVGLGYLGDPELTERSFSIDKYAHLAPKAHRAGRLYLTGDLGYRGAEGEIHYLGRLDRQLKLRGRRLEPAEIEKVLLTHPAVESALVVKWAKNGLERLVAYIVWPGESQGDFSELQTLAAKSLPTWMVPNLWMKLDKIPQTSGGKIDYKNLPEPALADLEAYQAPETPAEKALVSTLMEILGEPTREEAPVERLGRDGPSPIGLADDFLSLGGDSIKAIMAVARLEKKGWCLKADRLYSPGTLKTLAATMEMIAESQPDILTTPLTSMGDNFSFREEKLSPNLTAEEEKSLRARFEPNKVVAIHPLTAMQEAMLLAREGSGYRLRNWARIRGRLDLEKISHNLKRLSERHEVLRSAIVTQGLTKPVMVVLSRRDLPFSLKTNPADSDSPAGRASLTALLDLEPPLVDTDRDPLLGLTVYSLGQDDHLLALDWHHAVVDGWSLAQIIDELLTGPGPEEPRPFRHYLSWLASQDRARSLEFWRSSLDGAQAAATIPCPLGGRGPRDPQPLRKTLNPGLTQALRALSLSRRLTLNNLLQAALALQLNRYNGLQVQVFCGLDSGRGNLPPDLISIVGPLIHPVPVCLDCHPDLSFSRLASEVQAFNLKVKPFTHTPLADIRAATGLDLGDLLMVMENQPSARSLGELSIEKLPGRPGQTELGVV
ncbi:MAG: amino acid adenylation domain-containing protein, partial [Deltaproteobacteria bacterium]|nr:amino acid adenylation domain-containing protein [Deltaproteobacteria bacterium]